MDSGDLTVRNATYRAFVELRRAPIPGDIARTTGGTAKDVLESWQRLHAGHALVLNAATNELRMVNPFSAVPTAYRVQAAGHWWYANCAWDAFGICAALHADGRIEASCPDCGEPIAVEVRGQQPDRTDLWFHCTVPAAQWWDDIVFT